MCFILHKKKTKSVNNSIFLVHNSIGLEEHLLRQEVSME